MGEYFTIGLQAGKNVSKRVDEFIKDSHIDETFNFDPDYKKELKDGTAIYKWETKWFPISNQVHKTFVALLARYNASSEYDDAYKLICAGEENGFDEYGNPPGYDEFYELYREHEIHFPEPFINSDKKMPIFNKELPAHIIDVFEDFLDERKVQIENNEHEGDDGEAIIYGSDFDLLMEKITETLGFHGISIEDTWGN